MTITFYTFAFAAAAVTWFVHPIELFRQATASPAHIGFSLLYGLFSTIIPYILYTYGLQGTENGTASIIASIEPVVASLIGIILYGEHPSLPTIAGILLVLASIVICNLPGLSRRSQAALTHDCKKP